MLLYTDIFSGDEIFSDAFPVKEVDDIAYEVECKLIQIKEGADIDIGANPSTEEAQEELEDGVLTVNNVVYSFRLQPTSFDKKSYMVHIKQFMKNVQKHLTEKKPDRVKAFVEKAQPFVKKILSNFKDYEFYVGESMNPDGVIALLNYREDGVTPYFTIFKDCLTEVKLASTTTSKVFEVYMFYSERLS